MLPTINDVVTALNCTVYADLAQRVRTIERTIATSIIIDTVATTTIINIDTIAGCTIIIDTVVGVEG